MKHLNYTYQEGEGGIAEALGLAEFFAAGEPICVILGDNIIEGNVTHAVRSFKRQEQGAKILLKEFRTRSSSEWPKFAETGSLG